MRTDLIGIDLVGVVLVGIEFMVPNHENVLHGTRC